MYGVKTQKNVTVLDEPVTHSAVTPLLSDQVEGFHLQDHKTIGKLGQGIVGTKDKAADKDQSLNKTCSVETNQYFIC